MGSCGGSKIKMLRERADMTQQQLAEMLGVSQSCIAMWENAKSVPRLQKLFKLSRIFKINIGEIVGNENERY